MKTALIISIVANFMLGSIILLAAYKYREEITQLIINRRHSASVIMFGDSHTKFGKWNSLIKKHSVLRVGYGGHTSDQLTGSITKTKGFNATYVFIQGGGNDFGNENFTIDKVLRNLKTMADFVLEHNMTPVIQNFFYHVNDPEFNEIVDLMNARLIDFCREEKLNLIDITEGLNDDSGMKSSLAVDHAHLNEAGYKIWAKHVNNYLASK